MKNIAKAISSITRGRNRHSGDVIIAARRAARQARIDPQSLKWRTPCDNLLDRVYPRL